jgi:hypothetical protein
MTNSTTKSAATSQAVLPTAEAGAAPTPAEASAASSAAVKAPATEAASGALGQWQAKHQSHAKCHQKESSDHGRISALGV